MEIIREISIQEVLRRIAIGEIRSNFFPVDESCKKSTLACLRSDNAELIAKGIEIYLAISGRTVFFSTLPKNTRWYLAHLSSTKEEYRNINTINRDEWKIRSKHTCNLVEASDFLDGHPELDDRVCQISDAFSTGTVELTGITLHSQSLHGPSTIVEGHGRLIALYRHCVKKTPVTGAEKNVVALGISPDQWTYSPS